MKLTVCINVAIDSDGFVSVTPLGWTSSGTPGKKVTGKDLDDLIAHLQAVKVQEPTLVDYLSPLPATPPSHPANEPILPPQEERSAVIKALLKFGFDTTEASEIVVANTPARISEVMTWVAAKKEVKNPAALARSLLRK